MSSRKQGLLKPPVKVDGNRKFTREQLLKHLSIIGSIPAPLPPDLPPSPPPSRSPSPARAIPASSSSKRKLDADSHSDAVDSAKRIRLADKGHRQYHSLPAAQHAVASHPQKTSSLSFDGREDGEIQDISKMPSSSKAIASVIPPVLLAVSQTVVPSPFMPVRRPRRGKQTREDYEQYYEKYHSRARILKYSGERRFQSTYPPHHKQYSPHPDPPAPGTPYHTHGGLMSRLELMEALLHFVFALWCRDYAVDGCQSKNWNSVTSFLAFCKQKWKQENTGARESAFEGLIHMIEAFIHQRNVRFETMILEKEIGKVIQPADGKLRLHDAPRTALPSGMQQRTPPGLLPSPAGTASVSSANSTPATIGGASTTTLAHSHTAGTPQPQTLAPPNAPPIVPDLRVPEPLMYLAKNAVERQNAAAYCMNISQQHLTLNVMREHFPRTFGRMIYSSLTAVEEHEPDLDDDEGELFWPGQCVTGQGIGWVCLMGKAMVAEYGQEVGYRGLEGIIPKPHHEES